MQGAKDRLRPILMTMGTAILGMVPLCFSEGAIGGDGAAVFPDGPRDRRRPYFLDAGQPAGAADDLFAARRHEPDLQAPVA